MSTGGETEIDLMNAHPDARRWNGRYANDRRQWTQRNPRRLLLDFAHLLPTSGLALDAASGVALHGLFLAKWGLHVIALDISEVGLQMARQAALERAVWLETAVYDLSHPWLPANIFDVIVNFRFLERSTFPVYQRALKPGGLLFFETFLTTQPDLGLPNHYLETGELRAAFHGFEVVHNEVVENAGYHSTRQKATEQLIVRKPNPGRDSGNF